MKGCVINWNKGKNLTIKTIKKKQKHKARGAVRTVVKQVPNDSFFNFFTPPEVPEDKCEMNYESETVSFILIRIFKLYLFLYFNNFFF